MLTVLATLPFLAALVLAGLAIAACLRDHGGKMLLALRGQSPLSQPALSTRPITVRFSPRLAPVARAVTASPRLRVAA
ncbi:MAG TPA: hypothetical protein VM913_05865 [Sphingomicrobium sp.]|nr:hypothetical protein [Sphingomicrobium sp.]